MTHWEWNWCVNSTVLRTFSIENVRPFMFSQAVILPFFLIIGFVKISRLETNQIQRIHIMQWDEFQIIYSPVIHCQSFFFRNSIEKRTVRHHTLLESNEKHFKRNNSNDRKTKIFKWSQSKLKFVNIDHEKKNFIRNLLNELERNGIKNFKDKFLNHRNR